MGVPLKFIAAADTGPVESTGGVVVYLSLLRVRVVNFGFSRLSERRRICMQIDSREQRSMW